jgi:hypothetical protein
MSPRFGYRSPGLPGNTAAYRTRARKRSSPFTTGLRALGKRRLQTGVVMVNYEFNGSHLVHRRIRRVASRRSNRRVPRSLEGTRHASLGAIHVNGGPCRHRVGRPGDGPGQA